MTVGHADIEQWDRYWAYGSLHSFSQVAGGNYQGAILDFWREQFERLQPGAHVLDIATGNGAVALLALEAADAAGIEIDVSGVDLASIDPLRQVQDAALRERLRRIHFHPRTAAESLPFDDATIDLACSQFGLEYSDLEGSTAELARVSAPGGYVALMIHHAQSLPLQATSEELAQLDFVLDHARLYVHARNLLRALSEQGGSRPARGRTKVERKQQALNAALQRIREEASSRENPRMLLGPTNYIHEIFSAVGRAPYARLMALLEETRQRVLANRQRLLDMQSAAHDEHDIQVLARRLADSGFRVNRCEALHEHDGGLLGWALTASKH